MLLMIQLNKSTRNDIGRHYRSIILYGSKEEETYINNFIDDKQKSFENKIVTEVKSLISSSLLKDIIKIILN